MPTYKAYVNQTSTYIFNIEAVDELTAQTELSHIVKDEEVFYDYLKSIDYAIETDSLSDVELEEIN